MKVRYIALVVEWHSKQDREFEGIFNAHTEFICDYLSLAIRKFKIETNGFNMVCISLDAELERVWYSDVSKYVEVLLPFSEDDKKKYLNMSNAVDRYEFYIQKILYGYKLAYKYGDLQIDKLEGIIETFRQNGYRHEWSFAKKRLKEYDLYVYLNCYFRYNEFELRLEAYDFKRTRLIASGTLLRTFPSRFCFHKTFRKVEINDGMLTLLDFLGHPTIEVDLNKLSQGEFNFKHLKENLNSENLDRLIWKT
jgi:hypothetical protein